MRGFPLLLFNMNPLPSHVAIIPDGNNRWAQKRGLFPVEGYRAGLQALERIASCAQSLGVRYLTAYLMSLENFKRRSAEWLETFFGFASGAIRDAFQNGLAEKFRIQVIGDLTCLPRSLRMEIEELVHKTKDNAGMTLILAVAYTGRDEILRATNHLIAERLRRYKEGGATLLPVTEEEFGKALDSDVPEPDLLIRSAGEQRLSGFLLWQLAYTEFAFAEELWPDFTVEHFEEILSDYQTRTRNFGCERKVVSSDVESKPKKKTARVFQFKR